MAKWFGKESISLSVSVVYGGIIICIPKYEPIKVDRGLLTNLDLKLKFGQIKNSWKKSLEFGFGSFN